VRFLQQRTFLIYFLLEVKVFPVAQPWHVAAGMTG